jgi:hypothetical protein
MDQEEAVLYEERDAGKKKYCNGSRRIEKNMEIEFRVAIILQLGVYMQL